MLLKTMKWYFTIVVKLLWQFCEEKIRKCPFHAGSFLENHSVALLISIPVRQSLINERRNALGTRQRMKNICFYSSNSLSLDVKSSSMPLESLILDQNTTLSWHFWQCFSSVFLILWSKRDAYFILSTIFFWYEIKGYRTLAVD